MISKAWFSAAAAAGGTEGRKTIKNMYGNAVLTA